MAGFVAIALCALVVFAVLSFMSAGYGRSHPIVTAAALAFGAGLLAVEAVILYIRWLVRHTGTAVGQPLLQSGLRRFRRLSFSALAVSMAVFAVLQLLRDAA